MQVFLFKISLTLSQIVQIATDGCDGWIEKLQFRYHQVNQTFWENYYYVSQSWNGSFWLIKFVYHKRIKKIVWHTNIKNNYKRYETFVIMERKVLV